MPETSVTVPIPQLEDEELYSYSRLIIIRFENVFAWDKLEFASIFHKATRFVFLLAIFLAEAELLTGIACKVCNAERKCQLHNPQELIPLATDLFKVWNTEYFLPSAFGFILRIQKITESKINQPMKRNNLILTQMETFLTENGKSPCGVKFPN